VCGDSTKNKYKRRGYLLKKDGKSWRFYCHNCGASISAVKWMKEYFPSNYKDYIKEILSNKNEGLIKPVIAHKIEIDEKEDIKFFIPILKKNDELFKKAIQICKDRMIPEEIWNKWYVAIDKKYKNRLIIPFFDNNNKVYYWQGKALYDWMIPKYLSRLGDEFNNIYNYYLVDKTKPVQITEGIIDALFLDNNVIAMTGLKPHNERLKEFSKKYFLLDSDNSGRKVSLELLKCGEYVFNWTKFIKDYNLPKQDKHDVNSVCILLNKPEGFTFNELEKYYTNSIYDGIFFR
jgi:hypothetical protein